MKARAVGNITGIIISIMPCWSRLLLSGQKNIELRKKFPLVSNIPIIIYSTAPVSAIEGRALLRRSYSASPDDLWNMVADGCGVTRYQYNAYFHDARTAVALFLVDLEQLVQPIHLSHLRATFGFRPPVSWRRAKSEEVFMLHKDN